MFTTRHILRTTYSSVARHHALHRAGVVCRTAATPSEEITLEKLTGADEGISVITLNRGHVRNALGKNLMQNFRKFLFDLNFDKDCRTLIVKSNVDGIFCAGADLKERAAMNPTEVAHFVHSLRAAFSELESLPMPTIAVLEGIAVGGGLELALSCDIRVAGAKAVMGLPETGLAIIPGAGGTQRLPRLIGAAKAKELIFTGENVDAQKAKEFGIVQHVTEAGKSYDKALEIAHKILPKGPIAVRSAKSAIDKGLGVDPASGFFIEQACYAQVIPTKDRLEGLLAFKEKRKPVYKGE